MNSSSYEVAIEYVRRQGKDSDIWSEVAGYAPFDDVIDIDKMVLTVPE